MGAIHTDVEFSFMKSVHVIEKYEHQHVAEMNKKAAQGLNDVENVDST